MSVRYPIRLLNSNNISDAYPNELLVNFTTGEFTILDSNKNIVKHGKPGTIQISSDGNSILSQTNLTENINIDLYPAISSSIGNRYGICTTAETNNSKTVTISNYKLIVGSYVTIKFNNSVGANSTLNINDTGAKPIYYRQAAITNNIISTNNLVTFIYDGTNYQITSIDIPDGNNIQY